VFQIIDPTVNVLAAVDAAADGAADAAADAATDAAADAAGVGEEPLEHAPTSMTAARATNPMRPVCPMDLIAGRSSMFRGLPFS
jgi:hypothetical protein